MFYVFSCAMCVCNFIAACGQDGGSYSCRGVLHEVLALDREYVVFI